MDERNGCGSHIMNVSSRRRGPINSHYGEKHFWLFVGMDSFSPCSVFNDEFHRQTRPRQKRVVGCPPKTWARILISFQQCGTIGSLYGGRDALVASCKYCRDSGRICILLNGEAQKSHDGASINEGYRLIRALNRYLWW